MNRRTTYVYGHVKLINCKLLHICRYSQVRTAVEVWDSGSGHSVFYLLLALCAIIKYHSKAAGE